jgi:hypothetical protein
MAQSLRQGHTVLCLPSRGAPRDAATKLIWLVLRNITEDWGQAANN